METWIINSISRELSSVWKLTKYSCLGIYWKFLILTNFLRLWKAVQVLQSSFTIKIDTIKNLVCVKNILDLKQNQFLKISKIIRANKKFFHNFFNINLSISFNYSSVKKIKNKRSRNLFLLKSLTSFFNVIIFVTAEGGIFFKNIVMGRSSKW